VSPARVRREFVPAVTEQVKLGPVYVTRTIREAYYREVECPAEYKIVYREVEIPAKYDIVTRDVKIPARYETVYKDVECPAKYKEIVREQVVPGHWEERTVVAPTTTVIEPRRSGIDIDVEIGKKNRR